MAASIIETPEALMLRALDGRFSKQELAALLAPTSRPDFLEACGFIERRLTEACRAAGDPCLESGCSCEGEACLQPVLRADTDYLRACGTEWVKLFADAHNRDHEWRNTAARLRFS